MIQVTITTLSGTITNQATFPDQTSAEAWFTQEQNNGSFGQNAVPSSISQDGTINPAIQQSYVVTYTDVTAQLAQQKAQEDAQQTLSSTDWIVVKIAECQVLGQPTAPLLALYASQLAARAQARLILNPQTIT